MNKVTVNKDRNTVIIDGVEHRIGDKVLNINDAKANLVEILDSLEGCHNFKVLYYNHKNFHESF